MITDPDIFALILGKGDTKEPDKMSQKAKSQKFDGDGDARKHLQVFDQEVGLHLLVKKVW